MSRIKTLKGGSGGRELIQSRTRYGRGSRGEQYPHIKCPPGYQWNGNECVQMFDVYDPFIGSHEGDVEALLHLIDINDLYGQDLGYGPIDIDNLGHPSYCAGYYICPGVDDNNPADICNSSNGQIYNPGPCVLWENINGEDRVTFLSLPSHNINVIPEQFGNLSELRWLNFNGNYIGTEPLPDNMFDNLTQLDTLWATGGNFTSLPESIVNTVLRIAYLQGGSLQDLPHSFGQLSTMVLLVIYNNELGGLDGLMNDDVFENLTNLRSLLIHYNPNLMELPESICNCSSLEELYAYPPNDDCYGCTGLWSLPECLYELTNLRILHVKGNQFDTIPFDICSMTSLEEAYFNRNNLTGDLPECIVGMGFEYGNFQISQNKLWCDYSNPETGCEQGCAPQWYCDNSYPNGPFLPAGSGCSSGYSNQRCD